MPGYSVWRSTGSGAEMPSVFLPDLRLHYRDEGPKDGPPLVLCHALGLDLTIWDDLVGRLPASLRIIRPDMRGHGQSDTPAPPYAMGALVRDLERLMDHLSIRDAVVLGLSIGGLVAQGLAVKRLDLVRGLILSNTAVKIGTPATWQARIEAVETGGIAAIADQVLERWFGRAFRAGPDLPAWRQRLLATSPAGYVGCCAAIAGADFYTPTAGLRLPTLAVAGSDDGATPPDLVRETAELIPGAEFTLIRGAGHLPFVEQPDAYGAVIAGFLQRIAHV